jgi:hypothetical protein
LKKNLYLSVLAIWTMMAFSIGCTKYPNSPEIPNPADSVKVYDYGLVSVVSTDITGAPMIGVSVFTKEGVPAVEKEWPEIGRNFTPVNPERIAPNTYLFIARFNKDGKEFFGQSVITVPAWTDTTKSPYIVYLVMHDITEPDTTTPPPPVDNLGPQGCFSMRSDGHTLFLNGSIFGPAIEGKYGWLVFDYSQFPMDTVYVSDMNYANGEYILHFATGSGLPLLHYRYGHYTMGFGAVVDDQYYYKGRTGCEPTLNGVWEDPDDPNWFGFQWDTITPPSVYTIQASAGNGGTINPYGSVQVNEGDGHCFTITPSSNYTIDKVVVDGQNIGAVDSYTFYNVQGDHSIAVTFSYNAPSSDKGTFKLTTTQENVKVKLNNVLWQKNGQWELNVGSYTLEVSMEGFNTYTETFELHTSPPVERTITLTPVTPPLPTAKTILTRSVGGSTVTISGTRPLPSGVKFGFYGNDNIVQRMTPIGNTVTIPATSTNKPFTHYWLEGDETGFLPANYDLVGGGHSWYNWPDSHTDATLNN